MIPAGIQPGETEFLEVAYELKALHEGNLKNIEELPSYILAIVDMAIDHKKRRALTSWMIFDYIGQIKQFLKCNASVADFTPDIKDGVFTGEYCKCPFRSKCEFEGKLCSVITAPNGEHLTMSELRITSHIRAGYYDKEIAYACGISENTVKVHKQNIQRKLQVERKPMIVSKAIEMGIA